MAVGVLVPISGEIDRITPWLWLAKRYRKALPDWELSVGFTDEKPWRKAEGVRIALTGTDADVVVLLDADCWIDPSVLRLAVAFLEGGAPWVIPHDRVHRLSREQTRTAMRRGELPGHGGRVAVAPAGGGCSILRRADYLTVGGIDPRFTEWGGEDEALGRALDTLIGPHLRMAHPLWHLWHPPHAARRKASPAVERLAGRYAEAYGNPAAMRALIAERAA